MLRTDSDASYKQFELHRRRERRLELRQKFANVVDDLNGIRSGLARHGKNDSARPVVPRDRLVVFDAVDDVRKLFEPQRDTVAPFERSAADRLRLPSTVRWIGQ